MDTNNELVLEGIQATACDPEDFFLGVKLRRQFLKDKNPHTLLQTLVDREALVEWANKIL